MRRAIFVWSMVACCMLLTACTAITRRIQASANVPGNTYPAANPVNPALNKPLVVDLTQYKPAHARRHSQNNITVAFAASGGGYRAANLTLGVLMGMEKTRSARLNGNFLQSIDYFSTVSGGGFGVGYYLTQLHNYLDRYHYAANAPVFSLNQNIEAMLDQDGAVENPLRADLTELLFFGKNRGQNLEMKLNKSLLWTSQGGLVLGDIFVPKTSSANVTLPYWVANSTIYQNAAIFPFAPDILQRYQVTDYFHNQARMTLRDAYDVPVSVGLTASASVPIAIPATTLISQGCDRECYLQLLDGGLSDNLGVYTALSFLLQDKSRIKVLVVVDAYKGAIQPFSQSAIPPDNMHLMWRVLTVSTDANRSHIKPNIHFVARDLLCGSGASNVVVVYLDLSHYPEAQKIGTQLTLTLKEQKLLLKVGQELVAHDAAIKTLLAQLDSGKLSLGRCKR